MDTFNFLITSMLMMLAIQLQEPFIALGILVINILTSKDLGTIIAFIAVAGVMLLISSSWNDSWWLVAIFGVIVIAVVTGSKSQPQSDAGLGGGYGDMFGGLGGMGGGY